MDAEERAGTLGDHGDPPQVRDKEPGRADPGRRPVYRLELSLDRRPASPPGTARARAALTVAGAGIGLVFPTVSGEIVASVPPGEIGVASGTNSALRELGGVFGVAILVTVFARPGVYTSPYLFSDGFKAALWVGAGFSAAGVLMAVSAGRRTKPASDQPLHSTPEISRAAPAVTSETS